MDQKTFTGFAGVIFLLIALLHALRIVYGWDAVLNGWVVPFWASWVGLILAGYLVWSAYQLMGKRR